MSGEQTGARRGEAGDEEGRETGPPQAVGARAGKALAREKEPATAVGNRRGDGEAESEAAVVELADGSVVIPLLEEELVVTKQRIVRERVVVRKRTETDEQRVEGEVASQQLDLEGGEGIELEGDVARAPTRESAEAGTPMRALLTVDDVPKLRQIPVVTSDGEELGHVGDVYYDEGSRRIYSVGVAADPLGLRRMEVPVEAAVLRDDALHVPYTKAELEAGRGAGEQAEGARAATERAAADDRPPSEERSALVRHEEELQIGTRLVEAGVVRARKRTDTRRVHKVVPRTIEHFEEVERTAPHENDSGEIETLPDGSVSIPIVEEHLAVSKRPLVRERVVIRKGTDVERYRIEATLRRERVVDVDEGAGVQRPSTD